MEKSKSKLLLGALPAIVFIAVLGYAGYLQQQNAAEAREAIRIRQQVNKELGLPLDFPREEMPIHESIKGIEATRGTIDSADGSIWDEWKVEGTSELDSSMLYRFYNSFLLDNDWYQKQMISIPNAKRIEMTNGELTVIVETEKSIANPELTDFRLTLLRMKEEGKKPESTPDQQS